MAEAHPLLRHVPAVHRLQQHAAWQGLGVPEAVRGLVARDAVDQTRAAIASSHLADAEAVATFAEAALLRGVATATRPSLRAVLNGSGVLLHTNSGRAPLPHAVRDHLHTVTGGYNTLELDPLSGRRGSRQDHCRPLLRWLCGAADALVVNNGAAAILLVLRALAAGRPVIVSRGELVEIGGGFRVPEVMAASGARLVEVGTTNRTHLHDYERALQQLSEAATPAAAVLQVHRSNFAVVGFEAHPPLASLVQLARRYGAQTWVDLGSGALSPLPLSPASLPDGSQPAAEPTVAQTIADGADLVTFSGDKLLGGPQAGLIVGAAAAVAACGRDPMARAMRAGGLVLAALEAVLRMHLLGRTDALPVLAQLEMTEQAVAEAADHLAHLLAARLPTLEVTVVSAVAQVGGGTHPLLVLPSRALAVRCPHRSASLLAERALQAQVPLVGRVRGEWLLLDVRSLLAGATDRSLDGLADTLAPTLDQAMR
jgi:L-seryl-tRNA(Ser) seleniumtransferase